MKNTRRMKRMARAQRNKAGGLNLTSLMDVFTILVLYLLVNQSAVQIAEPPPDVKLPDSVAEQKPEQTLVVMVSEQAVTVEGETILNIADVVEKKAEGARPLKDKLIQLKESAVDLGDQAEKNDMITIMAHRSVPFQVLKTLMSACTAAGYTKISLAVNQSAPKD